MFGSIIKGVFQGKITTGDGVKYYVEKREYHKKADLADSVHSVIYRESDVKVGKFFE